MSSFSFTSYTPSSSSSSWGDASDSTEVTHSWKGSNICSATHLFVFPVEATKAEVGVTLPKGSPKEEALTRKAMGNPKMEFPPITDPEYEWVDGEVSAYYSRYNKKEILVAFVKTVELCTFKNALDFPFFIRRCRNGSFDMPDFVYFHKNVEDKFDFLYAHDCMFRDLSVQIPFDDFTMGVLCILNIAPTQLHLNVWAYLQAFKALCLFTHVKANPSLFLRHFTTHPHEKCKWVSLYRNPKNPLLQLYTTSYKNFKTGFFKLLVDPETGPKHFCDQDGGWLFPFYWQRAPRRYDSYPAELLTTEEVTAVAFLDLLPRRLPVGKLIKLFQSPTPLEDLESGSRKEEVPQEIFELDPYLKDLPTDIFPPAPEGSRRKSKPKGKNIEKEREKGKRKRREGKKSSSNKSKKARTEDPSPSFVVPAAMVSSSFFHEDFDPLAVMCQVGESFSEASQDYLTTTDPTLHWVHYCELSARMQALGCHLFATETTKLWQQLKRSEESLEAATKVVDSLNAKVAELKEKNKTMVLVEEHEAALKEKDARVEEALDMYKEVDAAREENEKVCESLNRDLKAAKIGFSKYKKQAMKDICVEHEVGFRHAVRQAYQFGSFPWDFKFDSDWDFFGGEFKHFDEVPYSLSLDTHAPCMMVAPDRTERVDIEDKGVEDVEEVDGGNVDS
ncbi:hypothetical protein VNO78_34792 [Psophocarpus tetragonolobus]|uniref:Uncharacterized protein n=1 Tax=Psophocarpus tetragonolobus TaxID=3891 RepID=A0AAN9RKS6_PSOTE